MPENKPIHNKEEIEHNPDHKIDQDFKGYPHGPANDETIKPKTKTEEKTAGFSVKDGEKQALPPDERQSLDEQDSDGSANAFEEK